MMKSHGKDEKLMKTSNYDENEVLLTCVFACKSAVLAAPQT